MPIERPQQIARAKQILEMAEIVDPQVIQTKKLAERLSHTGRALPNELPLHDVRALITGRFEDDITLFTPPNDEMKAFRSMMFGLPNEVRIPIATVLGYVYRKARSAASASQEHLTRDEIDGGITLELLRVASLDDLTAAGINPTSAAFLKTMFGDVETDAQLMAALDQVSSKTPPKGLQGKSLEERIVEANSEISPGGTQFNIENARLLRRRGTTFQGDSRVSAWGPPVTGTLKDWQKEYASQRDGFRENTLTDPVRTLTTLARFIGDEDPELRIEDVRQLSFDELQRRINRIHAATAKVIFDPKVLVTPAE